MAVYLPVRGLALRPGSSPMVFISASVIGATGQAVKARQFPLPNLVDLAIFRALQVMMPFGEA